MPTIIAGLHRTTVSVIASASVLALAALAGCTPLGNQYGSFAENPWEQHAIPPQQIVMPEVPHESYSTQYAAADAQAGGAVAAVPATSPGPGFNDGSLPMPPTVVTGGGVQTQTGVQAQPGVQPAVYNGDATRPGQPNGQIQTVRFQGYGPVGPANDPYENIPPPNGRRFAPGDLRNTPPPGPAGPPLVGPGAFGPPGNELGLPPNFADVDVFLEETRTGRIMFGVGVNSSAGVTGQIVVDERNFDITNVPTSFDDFVNGTAFRGAGQGFRLEALPGSQVQRYLVSFTEPYLLNTPVSLSVSGFYFDRLFFDWDEQRIGGRVALGYGLTPDLSISAAVRAEQVQLTNPRVRGVPQLEAALGESELYTGRITLTNDTRDVPFSPTEGTFIELAYEQAFGTFDYPRGDIEYRRHFLLREAPDGANRHTLSAGIKAGFSGGQTPIYENYFAGGFSTLRGFEFRGASPQVMGVTTGGRFQMLGSVEYMFPITADDMVKGVAFVDYGTVEQNIEINADNFRVSPGMGLRINVPALGPAPLALDFSSPIARAPGDRIQIFSFFFGFGR